MPADTPTRPQPPVLYALWHPERGWLLNECDEPLVTDSRPLSEYWKKMFDRWRVVELRPGEGVQ